MDEIKVVPYIPDEDYDNPAMVVDFYEFTMANCLFLHGFKDTTLVFDMFFRKNPDNQGYSISAGQRKLTRFLLNYHFNAQDIWWLRTKGMSEEFCEYLRTYQWKGDMYALPEGTVAYPHVQMVRIECDLVGAILIETYLLQTMNFHSLIATKATRVTGLNTHTPRSVMEFGTRRAQGESAGNDGAYAAVLGGCVGTANCLAEMKFGAEVKAVGTVAHSFIEFFPTEFDAFKAFADMCEQDADALTLTLAAVEEKFGGLLPRMKWLNFGGGHHITRPGYRLATLEQCITETQKKYGVQVYLEPGEAWALNAGYLVTTVLDTLQNGETSLAILDMSAACHTPDVIEMPYRPPLLDAGDPGEKPYLIRLGGPTCLAGDVVGDYSFASPLTEGQRLIFGDMAIYTTCKNNTFNGMPLPPIWAMDENGTCRELVKFGYSDFKMRLGRAAD